MHAAESGKPLGPLHGVPQRLFKKRIPEDAPVTAKSAVLFRFGEQCNNHCPMCSNTGEASLFFHSTDELLRRAAFLHDLGFQRAVVTGGEATIHPGFWTVVERLAACGMVWDVNTHGRTFSKAGFAQRAVDTGLQRAIVSLHSFDVATSAAIFGADAAAHHETVAGIDRLLSVGVRVMLNCVLSRLNLAELEGYLQEGAHRYGRTVAFKFVFPSTIGKGGRWPGIAGLQYRDVRESVQRLRARAAQSDLRIFFESFPNCVVQEPRSVNLGRSAFGETHYLDDATGDRVYAMRHIEAELSAFGEACRQCTAVGRCPGIALLYARRYGVDELTPFLRQPDPRRRDQAIST
jgi:MoaA/NifB/PqqE/SkfB family radical SAM enzyme